LVLEHGLNLKASVDGEHGVSDHLKDIVDDKLLVVVFVGNDSGDGFLVDDNVSAWFFVDYHVARDADYHLKASVDGKDIVSDNLKDIVDGNVRAGLLVDDNVSREVDDKVGTVARDIQNHVADGDDGGSNHLRDGEDGGSDHLNSVVDENDKQLVDGNIVDAWFVDYHGARDVGYNG